MISRTDPRIRRALDHFTHNIEAANERTRENLFGFIQHYIGPCLSCVQDSFQSCVSPCFGSDDDWRRRQSRRILGHAESSFDFYDDWEDEETDALLGLRDEDGDRTLAGPSSRRQPQWERTMSYGTRQKHGRNTTEDETIIPTSSLLGFLDTLPFKFGSKGVKYKPSVADLQDHPGSRRLEDEQIMEESDNDLTRVFQRKRSGTSTSGHTTDSRSSRGDIFPSEDEMDDAVPLDDEFASHLQLERRSTGHDSQPVYRRSTSYNSVRTVSSGGTRPSKHRDETPTIEERPAPLPPKAEDDIITTKDLEATGHDRETVAPIEPVEPVEPVKPVEPVGPVEPAHTLEPVVIKKSFRFNGTSTIFSENPPPENHPVEEAACHQHPIVATVPAEDQPVDST
jgi:hypothetical protein